MCCFKSGNWFCVSSFLYNVQKWKKYGFCKIKSYSYWLNCNVKCLKNQLKLCFRIKLLGVTNSCCAVKITKKIYEKKQKSRKIFFKQQMLRSKNHIYCEFLCSYIHYFKSCPIMSLLLSKNKISLNILSCSLLTVKTVGIQIVD